MKKVLFAAFAGLCVVSSIMATSTTTGKLTRFQQINQIVRYTIPQDTTKKAEVFLTRDTVPDKKDTTKKLVDLSVR